MIEEFEVWESLESILHCLKVDDDVELVETPAAWKSKNIQILAELCDPEKFDGCEPDVQKSKEYIKNLQFLR